jgi:hypothetical protein
MTDAEQVSVVTALSEILAEKEWPNAHR